MDYSFLSNDLSWSEYTKQSSIEEVCVVETAIPTLESVVLADAFAELESRGWSVNSIFLSNRVFSDVRKWGRDFIEFEHDAEKIQKFRIVAHTWGANFIATNKIPDNTAVVFSDGNGYVTIKIGLSQNSDHRKLLNLCRDIETLTASMQDVKSAIKKTVEKMVTVTKKQD